MPRRGFGQHPISGSTAYSFVVTVPPTPAYNIKRRRAVDTMCGFLAAHPSLRRLRPAPRNVTRRYQPCSACALATFGPMRAGA